MKTFILLLAVIIAPAICAQTSAQAQAETQAGKVVATTSWTGAFAEAAGATDVHVLAPYDMVHPPEYELRPTDLPLVAGADLLVFAGYEVMASRLLASAQGDPGRALRIRTGYTREILTSSIGAIAEALGQPAGAEPAIDELATFLDQWQEEIEASWLRDRPVLVHFHQAGLAEEIGLTVAGVFGPAPLEARQIGELTRLNPALIIDNGHNPIAGPLIETTGAASATWINFPGTDGTRSLLDVLAYNRRATAPLLE